MGRGTIRRMVEGPVGLETGFVDQAPPDRLVIAAPGPPSSAFAKASADATSPSLRDREDAGTLKTLSYTTRPMAYCKPAL